ncbi:MAG: hypothetical protein A2201_06790 [Alicyclobacillus sp. RIFOXYA1_FULL_53_8]|nr:MAG: hypothetical protein A2201_06790 [Alicyclobacillus sp. RIFOXYA1_FULL_53_8]
MPLIQINILEGRTDEVKQGLIREVTDAVHRSLGADLESIRVLLYELPKQNWAVGGKSMAERAAKVEKDEDTAKTEQVEPPEQVDAP